MSGVRKALRPGEIALLRGVLEQGAPGLLPLLAKATEGTLDRDERLRLCEVIAAEFATSGVGPESEPLPRGLELEALIDVINRPNLFADN